MYCFTTNNWYTINIFEVGEGDMHPQAIDIKLVWLYNVNHAPNKFVCCLLGVTKSLLQLAMELVFIDSY